MVSRKEGGEGLIWNVLRTRFKWGDGSVARREDVYVFETLVCGEWVPVLDTYTLINLDDPDQSVSSSTTTSMPCVLHDT